jgi:hypothetical protein
MPKSLTACLIAALLLVAACPAAGACGAADAARTPVQVAARIDQYRFAPRAPGTFRALAGRGDPADIPTGEFTFAQIPPGQRGLIARMLPGQEPLDGDYWSPSPGDCRIDHAVSVASARVARFGENHPYVAQWLRVQRAVFTACRSRGPGDWSSTAAQRSSQRSRVALPPAMPTGDPGLAALQRDDRAYQQAALLFYQYDPGAESAFRAIAAGASLHAHIARYMIAALRARDLDVYYGEQTPAAERTARANAALADADRRLADIHPLAQGLLGYLGYNVGGVRTREAQVESLLDALDQPIDRIAADAAAADRYDRAIADIGYLRWEDGGWDSPAEEHPISRAMAAQARRRPLASWLMVARSPFDTGPWSRGQNWTYPDDASRRLEQEPGRVAAVLNASFTTNDQAGTWDAVDALIRESRACPSDDRLAAVAPLFYHRVRTALMYPVLDDNYRPAARQDGFPNALARLETWPWRDSRHYRELVSDMLQYLIAVGRIGEARRLRDRIGPRGEGYEAATVALILLAEDEDHLAAEIAAAPDAGQALLHQLSVPALARLAARADLTAIARARFASVAWTRLYALQRPIPAALDRLMRGLNPEIASTWTSRPGAGPGDRRLLLDVLRSPGLNILITASQRQPVDAASGYHPDNPGLIRIDVWLHSDNNWWCAWQTLRHRVTASAVMYDAFFAPDSEGYRDRDPLAVAGAQAALVPLLGASWLWRARDEAEQAALAEIPCAPRLLAERALAWRGGGLFGGRVPGQDDALALAVRATRYGCQRQGGHAAYSRAAFTLLHARFPASDAARRTPYWFDCSHFSGGCAGGAYPGGEPSWDRWTVRWAY